MKVKKYLLNASLDFKFNVTPCSNRKIILEGFIVIYIYLREFKYPLNSLIIISTFNFYKYITGQNFYFFYIYLFCNK